MKMWEMEIKCRLCSSEFNLISLFNGKCRQTRDYIRKLVEVTTGIKFEKDDVFKCICYPCTVQVYNFYIFKTRSIENERILQAHTSKDDRTRPNKMEIQCLDNIMLPDTDELQSVLVPWLMTKSKYCDIIDDASERKGNTEKAVDHNEMSNNKCRTAESSTQCDTIPSFDRYTQCVIPHVTVQTQTKEVTTKLDKSDCSLIMNNLENSTTQTELKVEDKAIQYVPHYDENYQEDKLDSQIQNLDVKLSPLSPLELSTANLKISPKTNSHINSISSFSPSVSSNPPDEKDDSQKVSTCRVCKQIFPSKGDYQLHRKSHMVCRFCNKKFPSVKRTNWHASNECKFARQTESQLIVELTHLEHMKEVQDMYPQCLESLKIFEKEEPCSGRSILRMRSRSMSSVDSFSSYCTLCRCSVSVLQNLKLGVDKSVQTHFLLDKYISSDFVNGYNNECYMSPAKKIKLLSFSQ